ncbi:TPA: EpsG family protein [Vibrio parahaemolyticus]|nr:EpsG family protein [Vibrio parahaemolyticus]
MELMFYIIAVIGLMFYAESFSRIAVTPILLGINVYLIFNFTSLDLDVYLSQLVSDVYYIKEPGYGLVQFFVTNIFSDKKNALNAIQFLFLSLLLILLVRIKFRYAWVYFLVPVFFLGEFNSLRQGFAAILILHGLHCTKERDKYLLFLVAGTFHISGITALIFYKFITINTISFNRKIVLLLVSLFLISLFYSEVLALVGKAAYERVEDFNQIDTGRSGTIVKSIYLAIVGFTLMFGVRNNEVKSLGMIYIGLSILILTLNSTEALFRLSCYLQCFILYYFFVLKESKIIKVALTLLIVNTSGLNLLLMGQIS